MGDFISIILLAIVQGIAEWFPISSSGHLVLLSRILGYTNTLQLDIALHFGTLMGAFVYFGKDILDIIEDILRGNWRSKNARLGWMIVIAVIPAAIFGYLLKGFLESSVKNLGLLALGFSITGVLLIISSLDLNVKRKSLGYKIAGIIGIVQVISLFRGISRSGSTLFAGLVSGLDEKTAIKFSFLVSIPVILGANILEMGSQTLPPEMFIAAAVAFFVSLGSIFLFSKYIGSSRANLKWFGIYVLLLALGIGIYLLFF